MRAKIFFGIIMVLQIVMYSVFNKQPYPFITFPEFHSLKQGRHIHYVNYNITRKGNKIFISKLIKPYDKRFILFSLRKIQEDSSFICKIPYTHCDSILYFVKLVPTTHEIDF